MVRSLNLGLACAALLPSNIFALNVSIPFLANSTAPKVSSSLISLSIEFDSWTSWSGTASRNQFFFNALDNLKQLGHLPNIRVGGNTEDHSSISPKVQFSNASFPAFSPTTPYPEATDVVIGDDYYKTARFLPLGTHVTFGVNLGGKNVTAAALEAAAISKAFSSAEIKRAGIVLDFIEIGNEPDLYKNNGLRPATYNVTQWVEEWLDFADAVATAAKLSLTSHTKLLGASFAGSSHGAAGFSPQNAFNAGLLTGSGKLISTVSQHHYSGSFCAGSGGLLSDLMTKSTIRSNLTIFKPDIQASTALGLGYILGETNSYACHIQPVTLTRSILDGSTLSTPLGPHVQPQYYAAIIVAEALGKTGNVQVVEIDIDSSQIAGYGFYEEGRLVRAIFINSKAYLPDNGNRGTVHIDLALADVSDIPTMTVKRLAISYATDVSGLTWGGQTYETEDGRVANQLTVENGKVADGLDIQDTEVVLVTFEQT
ncbi:hypothetical protein H0H93_002405 [Arthromyces matolae]|nr:hypothetical protein H0H93_002405 [Arthromyces matolae]